MKANVVVAISGGIAAYKIPILIRLLRKSGCEVKVVASRNALNFVTKTTLQTLSSNAVYCDMFAESGDMTRHISIADWADVFVVAPATADVIGKYACGIADDCLTTVLLAFDGAVWLAPAMNTKMYRSKAVQENLGKLASRGVNIISPSSGELACGVVGEGRMAEAEEIFSIIENALSKPRPLVGKRVLVTAGPTYEQIDPVRFIGNYSSGKMGFAIAEALAAKGASVKLIAGPTYLKTVSSLIERVDVKSAKEMYEAATTAFETADAAVLSAAVADYRPKSVAESKMKKQTSDLVLELEPTEDILAELGKMKRPTQVLVGFALETNNEIENAKSKLERKNLDFIVLNSLQDKGAGFSYDTNKVTFMDRSGRVEPQELKPKSEVAEDIVRRLIEELQGKQSIQLF